MYRGIDILLTAHSPQILDSFGKFIELVVEEFGEMGVEFDGYTVPRVHKDKWLTNKAPFKYGRHKVEYEVRTYKKVNHFTKNLYIYTESYLQQKLQFRSVTYYI